MAFSMTQFLSTPTSNDW